MAEKAFQEYYPDVLAHCYGCGRLNEHGHQIKSYWAGEESVCHFAPGRITLQFPAMCTAGCSHR